MVKAAFFDLDNTLYDQRLFFESAFHAMAKYLEETKALPKTHVEEILWSIHANKGSLHGHLIDDLIIELGISRLLIRPLIDVFHASCLDKLTLFKDAEKIIKDLKGKYHLGIITNGNARLQQKKIEALGLEHYCQTIIYTDSFQKPKPFPDCFSIAAKMAGFRPSEMVYIGDNPLVDFKGAKASGMKCARIRRGEFSRIRTVPNEVDFEFDNYPELLNWFYQL